MPITEFDITNFAAIRNAKCSNIGSILVIAGPNGVGKSTLLETLFSYLNNPNGTTCKIEISGSPEPVYIPPHRTPFPGPFHRSIPYFTPNRTFSKALSKPIYQKGFDNSIPGLHYIFNNPPSRSRSNPDIAMFFEVKVKLTYFENELSNILTETYKKEHEIKLNSIPEIFDPFKKAIAALLPGIKYRNIEIHEENYRINFVNKNGDVVEFDDLSSGEKDLIVMTFPLVEIQMNQIIQSIRGKPVTKDDLLLLIDSPETHLHSSLQINLLNYIRTAIEDGEKQGLKLQIIMTSHSQVIIESVSPKELILMQFPSEDSKNQLVTTQQLDKGDLKNILGNLGLSALSTGKTLLLIEGETDKDILRILYPELEEKFTLISLGGKGKIVRLIDSFDKMIETLIQRGIEIFAILDRDRNTEELIKTKGNETQNRIKVLSGVCLENYLLNYMAIYKELTIAVSKNNLVEKHIHSEQDISRLISDIVNRKEFLAKELRLRFSEELSFNMQTTNTELTAEAISNKMDQILQTKKERINNMLDDEKKKVQYAIENKSFQDLSGKLIFSELASEFCLENKVLIKHVAEKVKDLSPVPEDVKSLTQMLGSMGNSKVAIPNP
jgi:predicted ATP-dependent endonuclease of OLD family